MILKVRVLESRSRIGVVGDVRDLDARVAESYSVLGLVEILKNKEVKNDEKKISGPSVSDG